MIIFIGFHEGKWVLLGVAKTESLAFGNSLRVNETDTSNFDVSGTITLELDKDTAIKCKSGSYNIIIKTYEA